MTRFFGVLAIFLFSGLAVGAQSAETRLPNAAHPRSFHFKSINQSLLGRSALTTQALALIKDDEWRDVLKAGRFEFGSEGLGNTSYRGSMDARDLELPERDQKFLRAAGLPGKFDHAILDMHLKLSEAWSAKALQNGALRKVDLNKIYLSIADLSVTGTGKVDFDNSGLMQGEVSAQFINWRKALQLVNFESAALRTGTEAILNGLANGNILDVTFQLKDSQLMLGPLVLATLPSLMEGF